MIFFVDEKIDDYEKFCKWFNNEAVPQIEALGGRVLVQGVNIEDEHNLRLAMELPDSEAGKACGKSRFYCGTRGRWRPCGHDGAYDLERLGLISDPHV